MAGDKCNQKNNVAGKNFFIKETPDNPGLLKMRQVSIYRIFWP